MVNRHYSLSLVKQCKTLDLARAGVYCTPKPDSDTDLKLMRQIDEIHDPENQGQPGGQKKQKNAELKPVQHLADE